jgi:hypothetical protein
MAEAKKNLLFNRRDLKKKIRDYLEEATEDSTIGGRFKKYDKPRPDANIKEKVEYLLKRQMSVSGALNAAEHVSLDKARALCQAVRSALSLISSDNKDSCICKAINLVKGLVYADVWARKLDVEKGFKQHKKVAKPKFEEAKKKLLKIGKFSDVNLYDCREGLCTKEITDIATKLVL